MKKSKSKGDKVKYRDFSIAIEQITNDVKADPYQLVFNLLNLFYECEEKI